jgi:hypothetical protein
MAWECQASLNGCCESLEFDAEGQQRVKTERKDKSEDGWNQRDKAERAPPKVGIGMHHTFHNSGFIPPNCHPIIKGSWLSLIRYVLKELWWDGSSCLVSAIHTACPEERGRGHSHDQSKALFHLPCPGDAMLSLQPCRCKAVRNWTNMLSWQLQAMS